MVFHKRWLALLIPGVLWALAHLTYVRDPFYMRGIELTIAAVLIYGLFFWKFGLLTTIMGHIAINALMGAIILFRSQEPIFILSGLVVVVVLLIPVVPGVFQIVRRKLMGKPPVPRPEIRPAMGADIAALQKLPCEIADWQTWFSSDRNRVWVLTAGEKVLGAAWGGIDGDGHGTIAGVYVDSNWRRQYWGTRLADALSDDLKEMGAQHLEISLAARQKAERAFWASQGWRPEQQILAPHPWPPSLPSIKRLWKRRDKS